MSNYIPLLYIDVITYPCANPAAGLVNSLKLSEAYMQ